MIPNIEIVFIKDIIATKDVPNIIAKGTVRLGFFTESAVDHHSSNPTKPQKAITLDDNMILKVLISCKF